MGIKCSIVYFTWVFFVRLSILKLSPITGQVQFLAPCCLFSAKDMCSLQRSHTCLYWSKCQHETEMFWTWLSLWAPALNEETTPCYTQDSQALVMSKEWLCYCCTSTSEWQKLTLLSLFKPHVEDQSGLVVQKLVRGWGHRQLMPVI